MAPPNASNDDAELLENTLFTIRRSDWSPKMCIAPPLPTIAVLFKKVVFNMLMLLIFSIFRAPPLYLAILFWKTDRLMIRLNCGKFQIFMTLPFPLSKEFVIISKRELVIRTVAI
jgi:hypothetical protein